MPTNFEPHECVKFHTGKWFRVGYELTDLAMSL